jgi:hypothetical protein
MRKLLFFKDFGGSLALTLMIPKDQGGGYTYHY